MFAKSLVLFGLLASATICEAGGKGGGNRSPPRPPTQGNVVSNTLEEYIHEFGTPDRNRDLNCPQGTFITQLCGNRFSRVTDRFQTFGLAAVSLTCSDGSRVDPSGIGHGERCLSQPSGFRQIGIGHGGNIDRIRDTTLPDGTNPPNFIGNFGGDIHNIVVSTGLRLTGVTVGYKPNDGLAYYVRFIFRDLAFDDGVCIDPNLLRRSDDLEAIESELASENVSTTELAVPSTKRQLTRLFKRNFTVQVAIQVAQFVCNALIMSLSKAKMFGQTCQGKHFSGGIASKGDDVVGIRNMITAFGCNAAGSLVEIAASGAGRVIMEELGNGVRRLCGAIFHIGKNNAFRACNFS
ncbi:hypothetical protein HK102_006935 [Quaeritorhiza haematococci]|nr:hypothetical protein HK102_006935 [Quaeritorhiza haematococci]